MKKGCAWRNIWQKGRQSNEKIENVLKYAMPGTRIYLNLECENNRPVLYLRNISAESLNVRPEELTERFVRGDSSRSTEGSGLRGSMRLNGKKEQRRDNSTIPPLHGISL